MKILLYVTTHLSVQHDICLQKCWNITTGHPVLSQADVHFFAPRSTWSSLRRRVTHATYSAPSVQTKGDKQRGAIEAMTNPASRELFRRYDWIIRLNPDVTILSFAPIFSQMTEDVDALVGDCYGRVMTDFTVFRPRAIDRDPIKWVCPAKVPRPNAECEMTHMLRPTTLDGRVRTIYRTTTPTCRFGWVGTVVHHNGGKGCTVKSRGGTNYCRAGNGSGGAARAP